MTNEQLDSDLIHQPYKSGHFMLTKRFYFVLNDFSIKNNQISEVLYKMKLRFSIFASLAICQAQETGTFITGTAGSGMIDPTQNWCHQYRFRRKI